MVLRRSGLVLSAVLLFCTWPIHATSPAPQGSPDAERAKQEPTPQTLTGIVEWEYKPLAWDCDVPSCDHFALYDDATRINYELDDARKALPFEGKRARVTGVVDAKNHVIHLLSIEGAK